MLVGPYLEATMYRPRFWRKHWLVVLIPMYNGKRQRHSVSGKVIPPIKVTGNSMNEVYNKAVELDPCWEYIYWYRS